MLFSFAAIRYTIIRRQELNIDGKKVLKSVIKLQEGDCIVAMSDGCPHAGIGIAFNFGWKWEDIADFMRTIYAGGVYRQDARDHACGRVRQAVCGISRETTPPHVWSRYDDGSR